MATTKAQKYIEGIGRRKRSVARVRIIPGGKDFVVNDRPLDEFFGVEDDRVTAQEALTLVGELSNMGVTVHVSGGGISSQAEAIRLGSARALVNHNEELRGQLKEAGFLKRDPRQVERKKPGLKKARKAPQWSKR